MRSCGVVHTNSTALNCPQVDVDYFCCPVLRSKAAFKVESGRLANNCGNPLRKVLTFAADGLGRVTGEQVCNHQSERTSVHVSEKPPADLHAALGLGLYGWLSQIFSVGVPLSNKDDGVKQIEQTDPGSGVDSRGLVSALGTCPVQFLEHTAALPLQPDYMQEGDSTGTSSAAASVIDFVSSLPSIGVFQGAPHPGDPRVGQISEAYKFSNSFAQFGGVLSTSSSEKMKTEVCGRSSLCVTPDDLGSPEALASWLSDRLPLGISQLNLWGTAPGTKRVSNLWIELMEGEILLEDCNPPKRTVHVASVKIKNEAGQLLVEAHQEMADGTIRLRNRPLSEKMRPGENVEDACFRGIFEELGCQLGAKNRVKILSDSYRRQEEERESLSYPGLLTSYVIHSIEATIDNLPEIEFCTVENEISGASCSKKGYAGPSVARDSKASCFAGGVKKHFWRWVSQAS